MKKYALAVAAFLLVACGDTVENVNQMGMDVVDSVADLPECTSKNEGEQALVKGESTVRVCVDGEWFATASGDAGDFSCKTEELKDGSGLKIICNGDSIGVVLNGNDGKAGKDGQSGTGCSITDRTDSTMTVVCGDSTIVMPMLPGTGNDTLELDSERVAVSLDSLAGYSQKGPFLKGSTVYLYELSDGRTLKQTNGNFTSIITRDDGRYKFTARDLVSQYAMIVVDGNYRNEVTGKSSEASIRLRAITDMRKRSDANINLLTHLEFDRVYYLVTREHKTVKQAKKQAQNEIFKAFHIEIDENTDAEDLDVFGKTDADAALLAISVLLQGDGNATDLSILLTEISDDLAADGKWDGPGSDTLRAKLADWAVYADGKGRLREIRNYVSGWHLSKNEPPAFEKFVRNFVNIETKLGKCGDKTIPVGTVKKIDDTRSKYYAKDYGDTAKTKERFICADADSAWWRLATDIEKDTVGWGTGTNNNYTYEVRPGQVNKNLYYYKAYESEIWRDAEEIEYDTYDYENNRAWTADPTAVEGDIRKGVVTDSVIYVYMDVDHQMTWRVADIIEAQLGGCVANRDSVGYARAICLEGGPITACGSAQVDLTKRFMEGYYICHDTRGEDNPLWEWGLATPYEYDTYKLPHDTTGRVLKGRVTDNYYVWNGSKFDRVEGLDVAIGRACSERNIDQVVKYVVDEETPKVYKCQGVEWEDFGWRQVDGETPMENRTGYVVDADETQYPVFVDPKGQVWMSKNLDIEVDSSYCYDDDVNDCAANGRLYTWNAAKNACPEGWHLPDGAEYQSLKESVDFGYLVTKSNWLSSYGAGSDEYGFMAYPAGFRRVDGTYGVSLNTSYAFFWTSSEYNGHPECVLLNRGEFNVGANNFEKDEAISVRCVLD